MDQISFLRRSFKNSVWISLSNALTSRNISEIVFQAEVLVFTFQFFHAAFSQKDTMVDDSDVISQQGDFRKNMAGDQNRLSALHTQIPNKIPYLGNADRVQAVCRLIQNQQLRVMQDCICYAKTLLHSKGILAKELFVPIR